MDEENKIENSYIEESKIEDSEIKDSKVVDSILKGSRIEDSEVVGQKIQPKEFKSEKLKKSEEELMKERKENVIRFFKNKQIWVLGLLIIALILGIYIRSMPMQDHGGRPGLWDITTDTWTLGPDLDPWLFTRYAETIIEQGELPEIDMMRNVPLGFDMLTETELLPYMIAWTYYLINFFGDYPLIFAAAVFPVVMFIFTIISFFLFVREIFSRKTKESKTKANLIAIISTFFMIVTPAFLSRTVAGIPEKESAAFFFIFLSFYLFLKSWKSEKLKESIIFTILAGISTALLALIWGGAFYVFISISVAVLIAFILNKTKKREFIIFSLWMFFSFLLMILSSHKYSPIGVITSLSTGVPFLVLFILIIHYTIWNNKIKFKFLDKIKLPKNIISLSLAILILIVLSSIFMGPNFIIEKVNAISQILFKPVTGRWNITVAENRQPFFTEWKGSFGPHFKGIAITFWLFFAGSVILFKKMLKSIKNKDSWILTGLYVLFFCGVVFSRYSDSSVFNGENFISKFFYYISALLLIGFLIYFYIRYQKQGDESFKLVDYEFLLLFAFFTLCLFTARGAVRLIMVLAPIAPIFISYLIVESIELLRKTKDETLKIIVGALVVLILLLSIFSFWAFYKEVKTQAYSFIPSYYNQQWQKAMEWVRNETHQDSVFAHWWDYGYWVQSIGKRATVLDGGNAISYWNYLMGRVVLTGDNQDDALEFLYNHNATHLLIDSSDLGKYTAFSSIGSDIDYDRYSWIGTFLLNEQQTQETNNLTVYFYSGGSALDEDLMINESGKEVWLPKQVSGVGAIILSVNKSGEFQQPYVIMVYQGLQHKVELRYLSIGGKFIDFNSGIEATVYVFPSLIQQGQGIGSNPIGAAIFISPRLMRGMLSQIYILNDPLDNFPNFKLVHTEPNFIINDLNNQGMNLPDFIYYQGIQGSIKIWEIEYSGDEQLKEEYSDTDYAKYIDWKL